MKKIIIFLLTSIFLLSLVSASNLNIHVRPVITGVYQPTTSFDYEFNFSNSDDCTSPVLSRSVTISTDIYGIGYTSLNISSLNSTPAYMCEYRNGLIRKVHTLGSGLFSTIHVNSNSYFEGDVSVNGNINVTGGDICISGGNCLSGTVSGDITEVNTNGEYLIGGADTGAISILINETILNETINALDTDTTYSDLSEFNNDVGFVTNISMNKSIDCSNIDGATSNLCTIVDTDTQIPKWIIDNDYLDNVSDVLTFDETLLNATIDARDSDTTYSESDDYLTLSGEVFGFSETLLNATIAALDTDTNTQIPKWSIDNIYLDNVSDVLTFDETLLNATIDVRSDFDTTIGNCSVDNSCSGILYDSEVNTFIELQSIVSDAILLNKTYADLTYSNTDAQTLSFIGGDNITISGGNSINISSISAGGDSWSDPVDSNIVPDTDNSYDLGDVSHEFKDLYIDGTGNIDTIQTAIMEKLLDFGCHLHQFLYMLAVETQMLVLLLHQQHLILIMQIWIQLLMVIQQIICFLLMLVQIE